MFQIASFTHGSGQPTILLVLCCRFRAGHHLLPPRRCRLYSCIRFPWKPSSNTCLCYFMICTRQNMGRILFFSLIYNVHSDLHWSQAWDPTCSYELAKILDVMHRDAMMQCWLKRKISISTFHECELKYMYILYNYNSNNYLLLILTIIITILPFSLINSFFLFLLTFILHFTTCCYKYSMYLQINRDILFLLLLAWLRVSFSSEQSAGQLLVCCHRDWKIESRFSVLPLIKLFKDDCGRSYR